MNVYVETNFVLEQAYLQEQHVACEEILLLAEAQRANLILPTFCIGESYGALIRRKRRRMRLHGKLSQELKELSRSKPYTTARADFQEITKILSTSGREENRRLEDTLLRVVNISTLIPMDGRLVGTARELQASRALKPQDPLVYASVLSHLGSHASTPSCFITRNSKDFSNPYIVSDLEQFECLLFTSFGAAYGYLRSHA